MKTIKYKSVLKDRYLRPAFLMIILDFWTILIFAAIIWDFVTKNGSTNVLNSLSVIYIGILSIYSAEKEFRRWYSSHSGQHPGELYVIAWTIIMVAIIISDLLLKSFYEVPDVVISTYIVVVGILAITKSSKRIFLEKEQGVDGDSLG
jgi:hypothetical protein